MGPAGRPQGAFADRRMSENAIFWDKVPKPIFRIILNHPSGRGERRGAGRRGGAGPSRPAPRFNFRFCNCSCDESAEKCAAVRRGRRSCVPLAGLILSLLKKKTRRSAAGGLCARGGRAVAHARRSLFIQSAPAEPISKKRKAARSVIGCLSFEVLDFLSVFGVHVPKYLFWDIRMYAFMLFSLF